MFRLTLGSIRANRARFLLTGLAVLLGVAFMAGTLVLTDTTQAAYDAVAGDVYRQTDAVVRSSRSIDGATPGSVTDRGSVDDATLAAIRAVPSVRAAEGQQRGVAVVAGHDGRLLDTNPHRSVPLALAWLEQPELNPLDLVSGRAPQEPDEIVIDQRSAELGDLSVGDTVTVVSPTGSQPYRIAGVATYGGSASAAGAQVVAFTPATAAEVLGTPGRASEIDVLAAAGTSGTALVEQLRAALQGRDVEVLSRADAVADARNAGGGSLAFVSVFLLTFAVVALVVGAFVIHNAFSITVAQRTRETALLRAIGASRRQVMRAIRLEALATGVAASAVGVVAGIGLAEGLRALMDAFGVDLPSGGTVVRPGTVAVAAVTGIVVTLVAAWLPARRAGRVSPIEALRGASVERLRGSARRAVLGVLVTGGGVALLAHGLTGGGAGPVGLGALGVFAGVAVLGPVLAGPFARIVGWPIARLRGVPGELARGNAVRNPRRTAATASALMIGIGLVAFITVFASSAKASMETSVDRAMTSDFIVMTQYGMGGLSPSVGEAIAALPETDAVTAVRTFELSVGGALVDASAVDPAVVEQGMALDVRAGSIADLGAAGGARAVAVRAPVAEERGIDLGDELALTFPETGEQRFTVAAIYGIDEPLGDYVISTEAYDANVPTKVDTFVVASAAPGVSLEAARAAIEGALVGFPTADLMSKPEFKGAMADQIDQILNLVYVLLAMALVIALFGIANTLALSVIERRRELGLLRAVGGTRPQVRSTVRWESVLVALLGTGLGTAIGIGFGWALSTALEEQGFNTFVVPSGRLALIVALAAVAAVASASRPAHRAAKVDVLAAIAGS